MNDQNTTFNNAAMGFSDNYREGRVRFFAARQKLGNKNPNDELRTAQARVGAVNHRARVLNRA